jgi:MFS family permease
VSAATADQRDRVKRRARIAVLVLFTSFGVTIGTWAVHLPSLKRSIGLTEGQLGTVLLALGVGALLGMRWGGKLADRYGSGPISLITVSAMALAVVVPHCMPSMALAAAAAVLFGLFTGTADVVMNVAAVEVERAYGRPIMGLFHGLFSVGTVIGSLLSAVGFAIHAPASAVTLVIGVLSVAGVLALRSALWRRWMVSAPAEPDAGADQSSTPGEESGPSQGRRMALLGVLAFLLFLGEGTAMDWSSLHAQEILGASPTSGTMAFTAFVVSVATGRFVVDRIVERVGAVAVLRWGTVAAALGALLVVSTDSLVLALVGWAVFGFGVCGGIPQVFSAAGALSGGSGKQLSVVVGLGYVATLAGPAIVGWLAEIVTLKWALLVAPVAMLICVFGSGSVGGVDLSATALAEPDDEAETASSPG